MYSNLAPRLGQTAFTASSIGSTELRGGKVTWGSLGSSLANAFKTTTRFVGNAASRFANSQAFQDIKKGINDSGLIRNVAGLAGDTLNSLVDIGKIKLDSEINKLRRRALESIPADQLAQILQNYEQTHDKIVVPEQTVLPLPAPEVPALTLQEASRKRPHIEEITDEQDNASEIVDQPPVAPVPFKKVKVRGAGESEWQRHLNNMLGQGVHYTSSKYCY